MSTTIDERVVSMEFDNKKFESNVQTSLGTLDKLKKSLKFEGAAKGFENISKAAQNVDVSSLSNAVDNVKSHFSALEVMAVTTLANITNSAVNAGKSLVKSLTIDQISSGMTKYEQKTASVQTLVNSTGMSVDQINSYLSKLMWYSDETSYGFTDMVGALSTMTASGGNIEKLIPMIEGVANATAYAGKGAAEFSRIMQYSVNQAYSTGYMQVQDWKSIEGATVNSKQLQESLIAAGEALGTIRKGEVTLSNFRSTLSDKWLTSAVMEKGFGEFAKVTDAIYEGLQNGTYESYTEGLEAIGDAYGHTALRAAESSREAKTFTEAIDATKDAVSSGWMETFEIIFGNYDQARVLWTELCDRLWNVFASGGETRNEVLTEGLTSNWSKLISVLDEAGVSSDRFDTSLRNALNKGGEDVSALISEYGSLEAAFQASAVSADYLEKALEGVSGSSADLSKITDKLKKGKSGDQVKELQTALRDLGYDIGTFGTNVDGVDGKFGKMTESAIKAFQAAQGLSQTGVVNSETLAALTEAAGKTIEWDDSIHNLITDITELGGREHLIQSFRNLFDGIGSIIAPIKEAFQEAFSIDGNQVLDFTKKLEDLTSKIKISDETAAKLKNTFGGVFNFIKEFGSVIGGVLKTAFNLLGKILSPIGNLLLTLGSSIGNVLTKIVNWVKNSKVLQTIFTKLNSLIDAAPGKIKEWISSFSELPVVQTVLNWITTAFTNVSDACSKLFSKDGLTSIGEFFSKTYNSVKKWFDAFKQNEKVKTILDKFKTSFSNLFISLKESFPKVTEAVHNFFSGLGNVDNFSLDNIKQCFIDLGDSLDGIWSGMSDKLKAIGDAFSTFWQTIKSFFDNFGISLDDMYATIKEKLSAAKWGSIIVAGLSIGFLEASKDITGNLATIAKAFMSANPLTTLTDVIKTINGVFKEFKNTLGAYENKLNSEAVKNIAVSVAIITASIIALMEVTDEGDIDKLWTVVGAIGAITAAIALLMGFLTGLSKATGATNAASFGAMLIGYAVVIGGAMIFVNTLSKLPKDTDITKIVSQLIIIFGALTMSLSILIALSKDAKGYKIQTIVPLILAISAAILAAAAAIKIISTIKEKDIWRSTGIIAALMVLLTLVSKIGTKKFTVVPKDSSAVSAKTSLLELSAAMLLFAGFVAIAGKLDSSAVSKSIGIMASMLVVVTILTLISKLSGAHADKAGSLLMKAGIGMAAMGVAIRIIAKMDKNELTKGLIVIAVMSAIIAGLVAVSKYSGEHASKAGSLILKVSVAFAAISAVIAIMSLIPYEDLWKGVSIIAALSACIAGLIAVTHLAQMTKDSQMVIKWFTVALIALSVAVGVMTIVAHYDYKSLLIAAGSLAVVMGAFAAMIWATSKMNAKPSLKTIIALGVVVLLLGGVLAGLSALKVDNVLSSAASLAILLVAMSSCVVILNNMKKQGLNASVYETLGFLTLVVAGLGVILGYFTNNIDPANAIGSAVALSILVSALSACCILLGLAKAPTTKAVETIAVLTVVVVALALVLSCLTELDPAQAIGIAVALSVVVGALSACCMLLGFAGNVNSTALVAAGLLTLIVGVLGDILLKLTTLDPVQALGTALTLSVLIIALSAACNLLGPVGELGTAAFVGIGVLLALIVAMGGLITGLGALTTIENFDFEGLLNTGIPILIQIGQAIGDFLGTMIESFETHIINLLPKIGTALSDFMTNLSGFLTVLGDMDESIFDKVTALASAMLVLAGAEFINTISNVIGFFTGTKSMSNFVVMFGELGAGIAAFCEAISGVKIDEAAVDVAVKAGTMLAQLCSSLGTEDSWIGEIFGTNKIDLSEFSKQIGSYGRALCGFSKAVSGENAINIEAMQRAYDATELMTDMAGLLPEDSGWFGVVFGDKDTLDEFGKKLISFGTSLIGFNRIISTGSINKDKMILAKEATEIMVDLAEALPTDDGWFGDVFGGVENLDTFGQKIATLGASLKLYNSYIADYSMEKMVKSVEAVTSIANIAKGLKGFDTNGISNFVQAFTELGTMNFTTFANALTETSEELNTVAVDMVDHLIAGVESKSEDFSKSAVSLVNAALDATKMACDGANAIGKYFVEGLISGIITETPSVTVAATSLGHTLHQGVNNALQVASPSKVMYQTGRFTVMGLVDGIKSNEPDAQKAGEALGEAVGIGITNTVTGSHMRGRIGAIGKYLVNEEEGILDKIGDGVTKGWNWVKEKASDVKDSFSNIFTMDLNIVDGDNVVSTLSDAVKSGISTNLDTSIGLGSDISSLTDAANSGSTNSSTTTSVTINSTQNNYSPTALSRSEIYRQTKNQFSAISNQFLWNERLEGGWGVTYEEIAPGIWKKVSTTTESTS